MCDYEIICPRCGDGEADTDLPLYTSKYDHVCAKCFDDDYEIKELDEDIAFILDLLEEHPSNYRLALDLKSKQDKQNKILKTW